MTSHDTIPPAAAIAEETARRVDHFQALLEKAQRAPGQKIIHDLRVSIRRLDAAAGSCRTLLRDRRLVRVTDAAGPLMKPLGKLRDLHVQSELIARYLTEKTPLIERFTDKIHNRIRKHEALVCRAIRRFPKKEPVMFAAKVRKYLATGVFNAAVSETSLRRLALAAQGPVAACRKRYIKSKDMKVFHRLRIALKHLRYTGEMLVTALPHITARDVERIHALQREMGRLRDIDALAQKLKKYFSKNDRDPAARRQLRKITGRRNALLKRCNRRIGKIRLFDLS
jgi:CHAD domain-containing protein